MDNLAKDAAAARAAGMSYGQYMATKEQNVVHKAKQPLFGQQKRYECVWCGAVIPADSKRRKYCSQECIDAVGAKKALLRYHRKKEGERSG